MQRKWRFIRKNKWIAFFAVAFLVYTGVIIVHQEVKLNALLKKEESCQNKIEVLKEEVTMARQELEKVSSAKTIERLAREKLKMVRPNEIIYIIQEKKEEKPSSSVEHEKSKSETKKVER